MVTTLAVKAGLGRGADGVGQLARLNNTTGMTSDASGNVYVLTLGITPGALDSLSR